MGAFQGFPKEMFEFFMAISLNNNIEFFHANKQDYDQYVKKPLYALAADIGLAAQQVDPDMEIRPAKSVSRIRRDTRFSHNKAPYRDHMWIGFRKQGVPKSDSFVLYFDISCDRIHYGAGWYNDDPKRARAIREAILRKPREFESIITDKRLTSEFDFGGELYKKLAFPEQLPESLRPFYMAKGFYMQHGEPTGRQVLSADLAGQISAGFAALAPLYNFMVDEVFYKMASEPEPEKSAWRDFF